MPNFFANLGRSGAVTQGLHDVGGFALTLGKLDEMKEMSKLRQEESTRADIRLGMDKQRLNTENALTNMKLEELKRVSDIQKKMQEDLNRPMPIEMLDGYPGGERLKKIMEKAGIIKYVGAEVGIESQGLTQSEAKRQGYTTLADLQLFEGWLGKKENQENVASFYDAAILDINKKIEANKLELRGGPDGTKTPKADRAEALELENNALLGQLGGVLSDMKKFKEAKEGKGDENIATFTPEQGLYEKKSGKVIREPSTSTEKNQTDEQLIATYLKEPTSEKGKMAKSILDEKQKRAIEVARQRGEAYADTRGMSVYDTDLGEVVPVTWKQLKEAKPGKYISTSDPGIVEKISQARQRGGATTANVVAASKMYNLEAPELIEIRNKVFAKGLLPSGEMKDIEAVNQWLGVKTSDPDAVLLKKKTKFLADSLMRVMGGSQGGEWAFKVAADILDPTLGPEAFATVVKSHGIAMERMGKARQSFGKTEATPTEPPATEYSQQDLEFTAKKHGITVNEVKKRLGIK